MELSVVVPGSGFPRLRSSVTLLRDGRRAMLVDSGLVDDGDRLLSALAAKGLGPGDVTEVIATHLHYDHCGNHLLFPRARYLVSAVDFEDTRGFLAAFEADATPGKGATAALLRSRNETVKDFYVRAIVREVNRNLGFYRRVLAGDPRFVPVEGAVDLGDGVEILPTPGHTPGHLSVVARGVRVDGDGPACDVLIAGDALLTRRSVLAGGDQEVHLASDVDEYRRTRARLLAAHRFVVPGHDALVDLGAESRPAAEAS
jgi:glyoxylase-like metal-dependent hydrolase (beta-lactamase superfamily II)